MDEFNLEKMQQKFSACLVKEGVVTDEYVEGCLEISKFFQLMGSVFSFVSSDVEEKIEILVDYRQKDSGENYATFRGMIEFEIRENLLCKTNFVSGSRTLLRLHRGLDFIRDFLCRLSHLKSDEKTSKVCQLAYNNTLAKFHPWIIRKGAILAMYSMPTKEDLLQRVCSNPDTAIKILPSMLETANIVYNRTEHLYAQYNLHDLP